MEKHPPAYLSPSRLSTYAYCPAEFHQRYILKQKQLPTPEMLFGTAVHAGFEALFRGQDDELAFLRAWRNAQKELAAADVVFGSGLSERGLELLEMVRALNLRGEPEKHIVLTRPGFIIPFLGYVDLWADGHIYDFKTTGYGWSQTKADEQVFQPAIYSQAYVDEHGSIPKFTFVVLPRIAGPVQLLDGTRTGQQIEAAFDRCREIHQLIEARVFDCTCKRHIDRVA